MGAGQPQVFDFLIDVLVPVPKLGSVHDGENSVEAHLGSSNRSLSCQGHCIASNYKAA